MHEGMALDKGEPVLEETGGVLERKPGVPCDCYIRYSVCFARPENNFTPSIFSGCNFSSPTVTALNGNVVVMAWTDGIGLWEARSTNGGITWVSMPKQDEGKFPNLSVNADFLTDNVNYLFTKGSASPYEIGLRTNISGEEYKEGDTREIAITDRESEASISIEMPEVYYKTSTEAIRKISFVPASDSGYNIQNVETYLCTDEFTIPADAESLFIPINMKSKNASALTSSNNKLKVRFRFTPNYGSAQYTAALWRFENDHNLNKTISIPAERLRGRKLCLKVSLIGLDRSKQNFVASATQRYYPEITNQVTNKNTASAASITSLPTKYALEQNYPNPFNPLTMINYQLPPLANGNNFVSLKVYDVLGREVATLVDGHKSAGYYDVTWDASNMPSGVYMYKLTAGSYTDVKKMLLLR